MMLKLLILLVLINITGYDAHIQEKYALNAAFKDTSDLFKKLKLDYGAENLHKNLLIGIDKTVTEHVENTSQIILSRHRRDLSKDFNKGIDMLTGFQNFIELNFHDVRDMSIFSMQNGSKLTWFAAILDASKISIFQINKNVLYYVISYSLINGTQLIVNSCNYGVLLIVQNQNNVVYILRFAKISHDYNLQLIQDFELNDMTHLTIWNGMNQLYLGIASHSNISIFTWFGDYFDLTQVLNFGTNKLVPFQTKGFMYLAATGPVTLIFKYFLKSNEFLVIQKLPSSQDISFFQLKKGHLIEDFLSLSTRSFVVIYKDIQGRFVPFQKIVSGKSTVQIISNKAALFFALHKNTVLTYQYNGWKFVKLHVTLHEIYQFQKVTLFGKQLLLVKYKNNTWALKQPIWIEKKTYKVLQEEIRTWIIKAKNIAQRTLNEISSMNNPVTISNGYIGQLFVHNINEHNSQALLNVSKQYNKMSSKLQNLNDKNLSKSLTLTSLHAKKIQVKCKLKCSINKLNTNENTNLLSKLKTKSSKTEISKFKTLVVKETKNWKCPIPNLPVDNIIVNKLVNEISLENLQKNILKTIGNQIVSARHTLISINVINTLLPLNIALYFMKNEIQARQIKVKELVLTEGGVLLPFNGSSTVIAGSIKASKVSVKNNIHLQGRVIGNWEKKLSPIMYIPEFVILDHDLSLENAKIENLHSTDIIIRKAGSIKNILSNAISLYDNIPVSLVMSSKKTRWNNVILQGPQNWVTINSQNIFGKKHFPHNIEITKSSYENLRFPHIEAVLCGTSIIVPEIKISVLTANNITVKNLKSSHVFGNLNVRYAINNSAYSSKSLHSFTEQYYDNIKAKSIFTAQIDGINITTLERLINLWVEPNILRTVTVSTDVIINVLQSPVQFYIEPSKIIRSMASKQNTYAEHINNINFIDFLTNIVKFEDTLSLGTITFNKGFTANHIHISYSSLHLVHTEKNLSLHRKRISESIEVNVINLPYFFGLVQNNTLVKIIIKGSTTFHFEPMIHNINEHELTKLFMQTWMTKNSTSFYGKNLHIMNALITGNIILNNHTSTLDPEIWQNISKHVLSKTKLQKIIVETSLHNAEISTIVGLNSSVITSLASDFSDMFHNSLLKDKVQNVKTKWKFDKLNILGKMNVRKRINNMDLKTDVIRYSPKKNIITGKKTIRVLTTENLNGLNFANWVDNAVMNKEKYITIKGQKNFITTTFNNIILSGSLMEQNVSGALLKSKNQIVHIQKIIYGSLNCSTIFIHGLVNDVNLTDLLGLQLKKQSLLQQVETEIELQKDIIIIGSLIVNETYAGANMKNFNKHFRYMPHITEIMNNYSKIITTINVALKNRANYINKLEIFKDTTDISRNATNTQKEQCKFKNVSQYCVNEYIEKFVLKSNISNFLLIKSISLDEKEYVVWINFDFVSIYVYDNVNKYFIHLKDLHIPKIIEAFVEPMLHSLWIVLRLSSHTLVLNYQPQKDLQEFVLPVTDVFTMSQPPNNQLLLFLSSGVWDLKGLSDPSNIIELPLQGKVDAFIHGFNYLIKYTPSNKTIFMKARYVGN